METQNVSDDDEGSEDGSEMEVSNIADETSRYKSGTASTSETLTTAEVPVAEADYVAMETSSETKECVLCKRKVHDVHSVRLQILLIKVIKRLIGYIELILDWEELIIPLSLSVLGSS